MASRAMLVEIKAGSLLMEWAYKEKMQGICIKTDCSIFVQGLLNLDSVSFDFRSALYDLLSLCPTFSYVRKSSKSF
ncbi:hypothetical protein RHMOL_Rhmol01G0120600 [Rhododendron molle]|uniref:Uncharacterized protein n=1 Tax=Rhododendron molle TaxID=49168 RepID=A0ACC0Q130_RHOML|nr:hypothetical protein RHMOL_Rhmol01G0120600 [Rhododendron molle]